jgi:hypothetical protein
VKTFKRDYVRVNPIPDARTVLLRIDHWMEDYNSEYPAFPAGLPLTAGVHCITQTSRVSSPTNGTHCSREQAMLAATLSRSSRSPRKRCCSMTLIADSGVRARVRAHAAVSGRNGRASERAL